MDPISSPSLPPGIEGLETEDLRSALSEPPPAFEIPEEEGQKAIDFDPYIKQLAPSTLKILEDDFHAKFIYVIPKKKEAES